MKTKSWDTLSYDDQNLYLRLLWQDNHSEKAIADFFATTKGRVVRRRQTVLALSSDGRDFLHVKQEVDPERFVDLLDLHAMAELEELNVIALTPPARMDE
jgi:hypothetical protein